MTKLLAGREVWIEIRKVARRSDTRHVAVAFLGAAATKLLPLRAGDVLVANLSEAAIRAGSTNVAAARAFFRRGVRLCNSQNLHAKLFVFDSTAIVGSANASENSASVLLEAAAKVTDARFAARARLYIQGLAHQTVTPAYLRLCARWQKESAPARKRLRRSIKLAGGGRAARVWLLGSTPTDFDTRTNDDRRAQGRIKAPRRFRREPIRWPGAPLFGPQDQVIMAHSEGGHLQVSPPARFLIEGRSATGDRVIYIEVPHRPKAPSVPKFRKLVARALKTRRKAIPTRRIPTAWVPEFLQLWPNGYFASER